MEPSATHPECLEALRGLLLHLPGVRESRMFGVPGFFVGRKLFACLYGDAIGVKVAAGKAEQLLSDPRFMPFRPYGRPKMREWVQFPCEPCEQISDFADAMLAAYEFAGGGPIEAMAPA